MPWSALSKSRLVVVLVGGVLVVVAALLTRHRRFR